MEDVREEGQTTTEHAIERVREAILCGEIPPGARLHQVSLAERFGISRTPLRAALVALSHSGLVTYESNRGYRVRELSREQLNDAFMIRAEIEALACRLAANRITADEVHELHQLVDEGENFLEIRASAAGQTGSLSKEQLTLSHPHSGRGAIPVGDGIRQQPQKRHAQFRPDGTLERLSPSETHAGRSSPHRPSS